MKRMLGAALAAALVVVLPLRAEEVLRVGKSVPFSWTFSPAEAGTDAGIFKRLGLTLEITGFGGDAKMQQAMTAGALDIGVGGGPGLAFIAKGVPAKGVAVLAYEPRNMAMVVPYDSPVKSVDDLKGKKIGVTTVGSLTDWLAQQMAIQKGWTQQGVTTVSVGGLDTTRSTMKTGQVDAAITALEAGYTLEAVKEWRVLQTMDPFAPQFYTHLIFASDALIQNKPDTVRRFLQGWFETVAWMKTHKARTVEVTAKVVGLPPEAISRAFDEELAMFSTDGAFTPAALAVLKKSFIDMKVLDYTPEDSAMFTTQFVPVKLPGS